MVQIDALESQQGIVVSEGKRTCMCIILYNCIYICTYMHVSLLLVHMAFLHVLFVHIYCEKYAVLIHDAILKQGFG